MPGSETAGSVAAMRKAVTVFQNASTECIGGLQEVNQSFLDLQATWRGRDVKAFGKAMDVWEAHFVSVIDGFNETVEKLGANATSLEAAEDQAVSYAPQFGKLNL